MKDESTIYEENSLQANEATQLDQESTGAVAEAATPETPAVEPTKRRPLWTSVVGGAGVGLFVGAGSAALFHTVQAAAASETTDEQPSIDDGGDVPGLINDEVAVATGVSDDMSFSEAFAAARAEVGPGGVFEWHGGVYGTYYADEWNTMTAEERDAWSDNFSWGSHATEPGSQGTHYADNHSVDPVTPDVPEEPDPTPDPVPDLDPEPEIEVLGVVHDEETGATMAGYTVDDNLAVFVDVDSDNVVDLVAYDANGDQQFSADEIIDVSDQHIAMSDLPGVDPAADSLADNDLPDYVNDADTGGYYDA